MQNSKSRGEVRLILSRAVEGPNAHPLASHTLTGGSTTTMVDSKYAAGIYADDYFNGDEAVNQTKVFTTFITDWTQSSGTATIPTTTASASGDTYEFHRRAGPLSGHYNDAIDLAVQASAHASALADKVSYSLAHQRGRALYPIPSGFSYLGGVWADTRYTYLAQHRPSTFDTLTGIKDDAARTKVAQSFQVGSANPAFVLGDVYLLMAKVIAVSMSGTLTLTIEADSSGSPSGTALATATLTSPGSTLSLEPTYQRFSFTAANPVLAANTTYWMVITNSASVDATNYAAWANDSSGSGYNLGSPKVYDGAAWSALTGDMVFMVRAKQYPDYVRLQPYKHFTALKDSTRYLALTTAGLNLLEDYDGAPLVLIGQGAPALPTVDTSTLEIPYDYAVARAGMHLATQFKDYLGPQASALAQTWGRVVDDIEKKMNPGVHPGSIEVECL